MNEKEKQSHEELLRLIMENPDLPVIPAVDEELVCSDQYKWWIGSWEDCCIKEYIHGTEAYHFKDDFDYYDYADVLCDCIPDTDKDFDELPREELIKAYESLPWKRAIIVYITLPE